MFPRPRPRFLLPLVGLGVFFRGRAWKVLYEDELVLRCPLPLPFPGVLLRDCLCLYCGWACAPLPLPLP